MSVYYTYYTLKSVDIPSYLVIGSYINKIFIITDNMYLVYFNFKILPINDFVMNLQKNVSLFLSTFLKRFRFLFQFKNT